MLKKKRTKYFSDCTAQRNRAERVESRWFKVGIKRKRETEDKKKSTKKTPNEPFDLFHSYQNVLFIYLSHYRTRLTARIQPVNQHAF